ncbi:hypothetical protein NQ314_011304 [Rhamnusium bicolor]|uniref:lysozyme n=1 Tax=Rhamnusium bicolor TaxID=1586634 RepID=A0AAV8XK89_9CUCU|nr:hypothetical protein NQ314_011304 [Rhamnusium bicolor]
MPLKLALLLFFITTFISAKVYDRCELAHELKYVYEFSEREIPTWICIIAHESIYDTAAMNPGSGDHGLFQISQVYWCSPPGDGFGCNTPCASFRDDNITDDVQCVKRIFKEHSRISGDGFTAWAVYHLYCKGDTSAYIRNCFENEIENVSLGEEVLPSYLISEKPLDEDDEGYEFPPLPMPPKKTLENIIDNSDGVYKFQQLLTTPRYFESTISIPGATEPLLTRNSVEDVF